MNKTILENNTLIIEVCDQGAELHKLYSKKHNSDFLWSGDSKYWGRKSPVLFPIVGRLKDNETIIDEKTYCINQHGFARDMNFELTNKTEKSLTYSLLANEKTKKIFPFDFQLNITYTLDNNCVEINWNVKNKDKKDMYFSIGAHPAFNVPFTKEEHLKDYYLTYETKENVAEFLMHPPFIKEKRNLEKLTRMPIIPELFKNDALIYSGVDNVTIHTHNNEMTVGLNFKDFPFVGIWSPYTEATNSIAPFVCIEPWYGIADLENSSKDFENKLGINKLGPDEEFNASYQIVIGG